MQRSCLRKPPGHAASRAERWYASATAGVTPNLRQLDSRARGARRAELVCGVQNGRLMHTRMLSLLSGSALAWALTLAPPARAALDACGGIFLTSDAHCSYVPKQECETSCQTSAVEQSCIASLATECESSCTESATSECTQACQTSCVEDCQQSNQSSRGLCRGECGADCESDCASSDSSICHDSCAHNCDSQCENHCHADDETVDCSTKCGTTCEGRCTATATVSCQRECQTTQFESCESTTVQTCRTDCHDNGGAIFCDGQFVNASDVEACAAQIEAEVAVHIDLDVNVDTSNAVKVDTNGDGKSDVSCSVSPREKLLRSAGTTSIITTLFALLGALFIVRRRRF